MCAGGEMVRREGRLDQCGDTYLPTTVWSCPLCGYGEWQPAMGVHWRSAMDEAPSPVASPPRRLRAA